MGSIEKAVRLFTEFPGIGARQARRFVYFLLGNKATLENLIVVLKELVAESVQCPDCQRFFIGKETQEARCSICADTTRDKHLLLIIAKDVDLENIERAGAYRGHYFVLGGTIPILSKRPKEIVRVEALLQHIATKKPKEIIFALSTDPEGEETVEYVSKELAPLVQNLGITVTRLGRGLSSGAEIEYADPDTLKSALSGRK